MTEADLRPLLAADPFEPFTLHFAGGSTTDIDRPDGVSFPSADAMQIDRGGRLWCVIALDHVARISFPAVPIITTKTED